MSGGLGTSRGDFIESVREALGRRGGEPEEAYALLKEEMASVEARVKETLERLETRRGALLTELARVSELRGWKVHRAAGAEEALDYVRTVAEGLKAQRVVRSDEEVFHSVPVDGVLEGMGAQVMVMARDQEKAEGFEPATAELGVTGVDYAVAETGTAVVLPRRGVSRVVSLLPPVHLALVRPGEVLESLDDLYLLRRWAYYQGGGDMGSYLSFITGPSRTADIEQTLVIGAHGPRETHMVILEEE